MGVHLDRCAFEMKGDFYVFQVGNHKIQCNMKFKDLFSIPHLSKWNLKKKKKLCEYLSSKLIYSCNLHTFIILKKKKYVLSTIGHVKS